MPLGQMSGCEKVPCGRRSLPDPVPERIQKGIRTVVIEDHPLLFDLYMERIGRIPGVALANHSTVESLDDALLVLRCLSPGLVITDLSLTDGNTEGFSILRALRRIPVPPVIILTTSVYSPDNHDELCERIRRSSFDAVFHKLDFDHLVPFVQAFAGEKH